MKDARLSEMERYILREESVSMEALRQHFGISIHTVRNDVSMLLTKGSIEKVYGGVCARRVPEHQQLIPFSMRSIERCEAKMRIGREAAAMVRDGDVIFVDSGTTTLHMINALSNLHSVTIVTNNLDAINAALPHAKLSIVALPGYLQRKTNSFTGAEALGFLQNVNIRTAFMAATGLSLHGVTNSSPLEYEIKMAAMARSEKRVLLLDSHKFGKTALLTYARIADFDAVVTEGEPEKSYITVLRDNNVSLIVSRE